VSLSLWASLSAMVIFSCNEESSAACFFDLPLKICDEQMVFENLQKRHEHPCQGDEGNVLMTCGQEHESYDADEQD
jgi:hypothetical protein